MEKPKRLLALDWGDVWIGVAHTDLSKTIVTPYATWKKKEYRQKLTEYLKKHSVEIILCGVPYTMKGGFSSQTQSILNDLEILKKEFPEQTFYMQDERLSSQMAQRSMLGKKNSSTDHACAAAIILETYLLGIKNSL